MKFEQIPQADREKMTSWLNWYLEGGVKNILQHDKQITPMLLVYNEEDPQIIKLQSKSGKLDVDEAYFAGLNLLIRQSFEVAIYTYTTKIGNGDGRYFDAVKNIVILRSGLAVSFFTMYKRKGLFKKKVEYTDTLTSEITENVFANING